MNEFEFTDKNGVIWIIHNNIWFNTKTGRQIPVVQGGKASSSVSPSISPSRSLSPSSSVSPLISPSPSAARNLAETLIDNFNDNSIDTSKWSTFPISGPMMPVETSQRIKLFTVLLPEALEQAPARRLAATAVVSFAAMVAFQAILL